jgi:tRNA(fMet)-specific endonuclease VapC
MSYLLDTDTCIAVLRGQKNAVEAIQQIKPDQIAIPSITRYELTYGALRLGAKRRKAELAKIEKFLDLIDELPFQKTTAQIAARIRRELESKGLPIGPMDLQIAATALESACNLITGNEREFGRIKGLETENWMR